MKARSLLLTVAGSLVLLDAAVPRISAQTLLSDDFDGYADQAAFVAAWPDPVGTIASGSLSGARSVSAPNSIAFAITPATERNDRSFTETGVPSAFNVIRFSIDFFDGAGAANPHRMYSTLTDGTAPSGGGQLISLGLNNNLVATADGGNFYMARLLGFTPAGSTSGAFFKLNDNPALLRSTGWHNLAVEISDVDFKFFVDNQLAETVSQSGLTLRSYDVVRLGTGITSTVEGNFDNAVVQIVPEPSAAALGLVGLLALARRRRNS